MKIDFLTPVRGGGLQKWTDLELAPRYSHQKGLGWVLKKLRDWDILSRLPQIGRIVQLLYLHSQGGRVTALQLWPRAVPGKWLVTVPSAANPAIRGIKSLGPKGRSWYALQYLHLDPFPPVHVWLLRDSLFSFPRMLLEWCNLATKFLGCSCCIFPPAAAPHSHEGLWWKKARWNSKSVSLYPHV